MAFITCAKCGMGYFDTKFSACPKCEASPNASSPSPQGQSAPSKPPVTRDPPKPVAQPQPLSPKPVVQSQPGSPKSGLPSSGSPLSVRLNLPSLGKPIVKQQPVAKTTPPASSSSGKTTYEPRECKMKYAVGGSVPGFGGVTQATFVELRQSLAQAEREHKANHPDEPGEAWSTGPIIDAPVGKDVSERSAAALAALQERQGQIQQRVQNLSGEQREKFEKNLKTRVEYRIFAMSGSAMRPGHVGQPGRDAIREGLAAVENMKGKEISHTDAYFGLNKAMAVDDKATGATKDQFGKMRDKEVALPVLGTGEPRTDGMPQKFVSENLKLVNNYIMTAAASKDADPIELIAKQYMLDVTIHPCIDANGRSSLMATFPLADKFGLPRPLVTKKGSNVFHCQNGQATDGHALHPAEAMAFIVEGMSANLDLQEELLNAPDATAPCSTQGCGTMSWAHVTHLKCGLVADFCEAHIPLAACPKCGDIGLKKDFVT